MLAIGPLPTFAADPSDVFSAIVGEIGRQIERDQRNKQLRQLRPSWNACAAGDIASCDHAARFPFLSDQQRANLARMRNAAVLRETYTRNFYTCQKFVRDACDAALAYPYLSDTDRSNLQTWKWTSIQRDEALAAFRQNERNCYIGSLAACDAAINDRQRDERAIPDLERQRARLQLAEQERQAYEQKRQAALADFRRNERSCYDGSLYACYTAIKERHLDESAASRLAAHRDRLQAAEQQRRRHEEGRQAALAEFRRNERDCLSGSIAACDAAIKDRHLNQSAIPDLEKKVTLLRSQQRQREAAISMYRHLRSDCAAGKRDACKAALSHPNVQMSDRAVLERKDRELAPFSESVANLFGQSDPGLSGGTRTSSSIGYASLATVILLGIIAAVFVVMRSRVTAASTRKDPPFLAVESPKEPSEADAAYAFPLTGHMPTDVRRAIRAASQ